MSNNELVLRLRTHSLGTYFSRDSELTSCLEEAADAIEGQEWRTDMENAPKDETKIMLFYEKGAIVIGFWNSDMFAKHPKPYWFSSLVRVYGKRWAQSEWPTHWKPLPEPPK